MKKYIIPFFLFGCSFEYTPLTPHMALNMCANLCQEDIEKVLDVDTWYYPLSETHDVNCICSNKKKISKRHINIQKINE